MNNDKLIVRNNTQFGVLVPLDVTKQLIQVPLILLWLVDTKQASMEAVRYKELSQVASARRHQRGSIRPREVPSSTKAFVFVVIYPLAIFATKAL
jgi:hypothetical protein